MTIDILAARLEIEQLIYRYSHILDGGGGAPFAALFVEDGEIQLRSLYAERRDSAADVPWREPGLLAGAELLGDRLVFKGRKKLHDFSLPKGNPVIQFHVVSQPLIEMDGPSAASARSYMRVYAAPYGGPSELKVAGRYSDRFSLTKDGWRFASRLCEI